MIFLRPTLSSNKHQHTCVFSLAECYGILLRCHYETLTELCGSERVQRGTARVHGASVFGVSWYAASKLGRGAMDLLLGLASLVGPPLAGNASFQMLALKSICF